MDFDEITRILEMMREHDLVEFELERDNVKLRLQKAAAGAPAPALESPRRAAVPEAPAAPPAPVEPEVDASLVRVTSPIVGTFYRSSEPGAAAFADVGDQVKKGQVLCIIEAMKLMNEINAEVDGVVVEVHVENEQAVQFGEPLFSIRPA
jgi:acetyl-CoA carboxylase biotin carboxyl carrier protein